LTEAELRLQDEKMRAEIANLIATTGKLNAETVKLQTENRWYLLVVGSGATLAIVAIAKLFL
jgi:hypothetical protein